MNKSEKYIIESLCNRGQCSLEEFIYGQKQLEFWGVSFVHNEILNYVIFSDEDKFKYIDYSNIRDKKIEDINSENIIKVLLVDNNNSWKQYAEDHGKGKLIVINHLQNSIVYADKTGTNITQILGLFLNELKTSKQKTKSNMTITWALIIVNVIVYGVTALLSQNIFNINNNVLNLMGAKNDLLIDSGQYYRLITCMFLHGSIIHIASNMYSLYCMGYMLEEIYGKVKYLAIYFVSGITASIFSYFFSRGGISVGASGAIFGLLGAAFIFGFKLRKRIGKGLLTNIASVLALNIFISVSVPNIDIFAHMGGFIGGVIIATILGRKIWIKQ
ncbi:rhomboid family intramembrane serine protease [Clostridium felsineum]|uniref:Rhomboid protease GlpG n=1 Tax=Clostridium felsineum TaxID=36839 RepID=A0A1S8KXZ9_9CLOT|nr:rhomboid family intramembrane serine protease [Clostridium felsineum]URZ05745.1 Rhomboid protease GlpG [Clostridium felsineum]URZ10784.1 Rhomboid protease GlpG [Clostridium felsineum]